MYISQEGIKLLKHFEGLRLKAYRDAVGIWTIGYGHTKEVFPGMEISTELAEKFLYDDVWNFEREVEGVVNVEVTQGEFDALVCFAFNVGSDIDDDTLPEGLGDSTLLKHLNSGNRSDCADEFLRWNRAGGRILKGLVKRRKAERHLFLNGVFSLDN